MVSGITSWYRYRMEPAGWCTVGCAVYWKLLGMRCLMVALAILTMKQWLLRYWCNRWKSSRKWTLEFSRPDLSCIPETVVNEEFRIYKDGVKRTKPYLQLILIRTLIRDLKGNTKSLYYCPGSRRLNKEVCVCEYDRWLSNNCLSLYLQVLWLLCLVRTFRERSHQQWMMTESTITCKSLS